MDFQVQKFVSNLIENQFPRFYQEEGPNFVLFTKAYYEWMESKGEPIHEARELLNYRDIDNTLEPFLSHFQQKYLYGIPFNIISNKRFLLKHILDVYRSKGTIQCYRLLFRLIYNEDVNIYLPGIDIIKPSDGIWVEPKYIEVSTDQDLSKLVGRTVIGIQSYTVGVVENFVKESFNNDVISILYISNVSPVGGDFIIGELLVPLEDKNNTKIRDFAPTVLGSLDSLDILDGGYGFKPGDVLKIADQDPFTKQQLSSGRDGLLKVSKVGIGKGSLKYRILDPGFGFMANAEVFLYNNIYDNTGSGAVLDINAVNSTRKYVYNEDIIVNFINIKLNEPNYPFVKKPNSSLTTKITDALSFEIGSFGSIYEFSVAIGGTKYTEPADIFIRSTVSSGLLPGTINYSSKKYKISEIRVLRSTSNYTNGDLLSVKSKESTANAIGIIVTDDLGTVTSVQMQDFGEGFVDKQSYTVTYIPTEGSAGRGGEFYPGFCSYITGDNSTIFDLAFKSNTVLNVTKDVISPFTESQNIMVKKVVNSSFMFVYGSFNFDSTVNSKYITCPSLLGSQYAYYEISDQKGKPYGENEIITGIPATGNDIVTVLKSINSGKAYLNKELVKAYPYSCISSNILIDNPGLNYSNGDVVVFSGGGWSQQAKGRVITEENGSISAVILTSKGSGYRSIPLVYVKSKTGSNAKLSCVIDEYDTSKVVIGKVKKAGYGVGRGFWETTRGFLDNDKYIQDSYYYQDYSYEIQTARTIDTYKPIFQETFHPAGSEMFGRFLYSEYGVSKSSIVYEDVTPNTAPNSAIFMLSDSYEITSDSDFKVDRYYYYPIFIIYLLSTTLLHVDDIDVTSDNEYVPPPITLENNKYTKNKRFNKEIDKWLTGK